MFKYILALSLFIFKAQVLFSGPSEAYPDFPLKKDDISSKIRGKKVSLYFDFIKSHPSLLWGFIYKIPKGGHLHFHLGGNLTIEDILNLGTKSDLCVDINGNIFSDKERCHNEIKISNFAKLPSQKKKYIFRKWSVEKFKNSFTPDRFFSIFKKIKLIIQKNMLYQLNKIS